MNNNVLFIILLLISFGCGQEDIPSCSDELGQISYPIIAHSHNDYDQPFPLSTAIEHGFSSIEVDIVYDGSILRVSHDTDDLAEKPELEELYLLPILNDTIGEDGIILLVDIKEYSDDLLVELNLVLENYATILVTRSSPMNVANKVKIVLSGSFPRVDVMNDPSYKYLFIDGRLNDTDLNASSELVPIISMNITQITNSNADDKQAITEVVNQVHDQDKLIRFWKTNDKEEVWLDLIDLGVDIIGVDDLEHFCEIMKKNDLIN